ncbi:hypothetical protein LTR24_002323 [Lithohypha guttulata]|uniref:Uncharacterized protein n=1 Tax=Lithohypha guttulata TaxID=1690604 RepID=A0ABR0KI50_9EURO|nr:hypothetical protein LTR24_002323 [Lithohypha guttulata]
MAEKVPNTMAAASDGEEQTGPEQLPSARSEPVDEGQQRGVPSLDLNLWQHKAPIAITFSVLVVTSGILPIALYLGLVNTGIESTIAIPAAIFGAPSLLTLLKRSYSLLRPNSTTRPISAKWYHLDFFHINFLMYFTVITGVMVTSTILAEDYLLTALRLFSMPLSIIILSTCLQTSSIRLAIAVIQNNTLRYPCRVSSMGMGDIVRGASYTIVEDIVAVDRKQGTVYRQRWDARYKASKEIRSLLRWSDAVWGR